MKTLFVCLVSATLIVFFGALGVAQQKGLVLYFNFDEGRGDKVKDLSGNGNDGTFKGKGLEWVEGKYGGGLKFKAGKAVADPSVGYVEVPDSPNLTPKKEGFSVIAWVKPEDLSAIRVVVSQWYGGVGAAARPNLAWVLETHPDTGCFHAILNWGDRGHGKTPAKKGEWQHVGFSWDGSIITFYYNGEPDGTVTFKDTLDDSSEPVRIGRTDRDDFIWDGVIDDLKVFYRALTAEEILRSKEPAAVEPLGKLPTFWGRIKSQRM